MRGNVRGLRTQAVAKLHNDEVTERIVPGVPEQVVELRDALAETIGALVDHEQVRQRRDLQR